MKHCNLSIDGLYFDSLGSIGKEDIVLGCEGCKTS